MNRMPEPLPTDLPPVAPALVKPPHQAAAVTSPGQPPRAPRDAEPAANGERADEALLDSLRAVINRHELRTGGGLPKSLAVTGADPDAGGRIVSLALARVLADELAVETCWVDFDWLVAGRQRGDTEIAVVADEPRFVRMPDSPRLTELRFGPIPVQQRNAFVRSARFSELLDGLNASFDHVVFHVPSVLDSPGALAVIGHAESAVIVARFRSTPLALVERVLTAIEPTPTLAVVVTRFRPSIPRALRRLFRG